jgi:signal transduction histidine kinase
LIFGLLFATCNQPAIHISDKNPQTNLVSDSLWTPTGDGRLDSLLQLAAEAPQDTALARLYYQIGDKYEDTEIEKAKAYYRKVGELSDRLDWNEGRYMFSAGYAGLLNRENLTDSALVILQKALALAEREGNEIWTANILCNIGISYFYGKDWYETALNYYMRALPIYERTNDKNLQTVYYLMSQISNMLNNMEKAVEYGEKAVALNREYPYSLIVLASAYSSSHQYEKAESYYEEALRICELQNNIYVMAGIYLNLGEIAMSIFDLDKSEKYVLQSLKIFRQYGMDYNMNIIVLSRIELLRGNFAKSEEYIKEALRTAEEKDELEEKRACYTILSELAIAQRKYRENVQYREKMDLVEKEIASTTALRAAEEMSAKYETEKKNLEIERQQQVIRSQNMQRALLAGGIAGCVVILLLLWYMLRLRTRRNHSLAEINLTKDKFFSIISHDLKNPAVSQRDALQVLAKNARSWDADTLADYHGELLKSADGQVELIMNLLSWSKLQTGRMTCTPATFVLTDLLPNLSLIRKMASNKNIAFTVQIPENTLITADSNILATVIRNLLINAVKFTPSGGQVMLSVEATANSIYTFTVSDTGIGMSKEQINNLFRLDSTHSQRGTAGEQGSGLGLIVCRELLEKQGATLLVESEEEKGSKFSFKLKMLR